MLENNQGPPTTPSGHGGARKGSGRKIGAATAKTRKIANDAIASGELTPLEYMLQLMREPSDHEDARIQMQREAMRFEAAKSAAPYIHPRLAAVEHSGGVTVSTLAEELAMLNATQ